jgi:hypothetical protein
MREKVGGEEVGARDRVRESTTPVAPPEIKVN